MTPRADSERRRLRAAAARAARGTTQAERMPPALAPGWFDADERGFDEWVALAADHAERVALVGADDRPAGTWGVLFDEDETLLLARLAGERLPGAGGAHGANGASGGGDGAAAPAALAHEVLCLAAWLVRWQRRLQACPGDVVQAVAALLRSLLVPRMQEELAWVRSLPLGLQGGALPALPPLDAGPPWDDPAVQDRLRSAQAMFRATVARLREAAHEQLPRTLAHGQHEPAAALLAAFIALQATVQRQLNGFTQRLVDFHVDQVLGMRPRPAAPDRLLLVAQREAGATGELLLPAGTPLVAGRDGEGRDIVFRTDMALTVGDAQVARLLTLRMDRDPLVSPEAELGFVSRARRQEVPVTSAADDAAEDDTGTGAAARVWPLFGGQEMASPTPAQAADFGLAIASRQLLLLEGERRIELTLRLGHPAVADRRLVQLAALHAAEPAAGVTPEAHAAQRHKALLALFEGYAKLERIRAELVLPEAGAVAALAGPRLLALPLAERTPLQHHRAFLLVRAQLARGPGWRHAAGRLLAHWLLTSRPARDAADDWLLGTGAAALRDRDLLAVAARTELGEELERWLDDAAAAVPSARPARTRSDSGDPLRLFLGRDRADPQLLFARLFSGLFAASTTGPEGWCEAKQTHVLRPQREPREGSVELRVVVQLGRGDAPLTGCNPAVHGAAWDTPLPLLRLHLRPSGGLFPYTLLETAQLLGVDIDVDVRGLRDVALHNQLGPLDPGKPFQPFGPLPALGSYLVLGARELACKPLRELRLHLRWGGLPADPGGFATHYADWPTAGDNFSFRALPGVLRDGRWVSAERPPGSDAAPQGEPLFAADDPAGALAPDAAISFPPALLAQHYQPLPGALPTQAPAFDIGARGALLRLTLSAPGTAFGHGEYASVLTEVVSSNARRRRLARSTPLPRAPYTPLLEGLTLDYRSQVSLHLDTDHAGDDGQRLYHLHPFGVQCVHPQPQGGARRLLPPVAHDGMLFIGLHASVVPQRTALLFHLHEAGAQGVAGERNPLPPRWYALADGQWQPLAPRQVLADGTGGFLTSGVVVLDLPPDLPTEHQVMPTGLVWLAVGVDEGFERFAGLRKVLAQGVSATRELPPGGAAAPLPARVALAPAVPVAGLAGVQAVGAATGLRGSESRSALRVRAGERLLHRERASLPGDFERLVLQHFPDVGLVRCFGSTQADGTPFPGLAPGELLVAVVPAAHRWHPGTGALLPRLNAAELQRIQHLLAERASPCARVLVRNASYERIQVRCTVGAAAGAPEGELLRRCEQALADHLNPWVEGGMPARFGWVVRAEDIENRLRAVPGVGFVTGLSLLHVARDDDGHHALGDTARMVVAPAGAAGMATAQAVPVTPRVHRVAVRPAMPWSVAVPMPTQRLSVTNASLGRDPVASGIGDLAIGRSFIVGATAAATPRHG
jgi:hypothetical protein